MDFGSASVSAQSAPIPMADTRPTADVAASKKAREPEFAFAAPASVPSTSQAASVSRSMLLATGVEETDTDKIVTALTPAERALKPYGTPMLPDRAHSEATAETRADEGTDATVPEDKVATS